MKLIGITGGVGAGKSELLHYIEREFSAKIVLADELAHELMRPGTDCFAEIERAFAEEDLYAEDGGFDKMKLAEVIFSDPKKRERLNSIVHPAVKREILRLVANEREAGRYAYFILEAALLIEDGYDKICDELWYVDAKEEVRRKRLKENRGYSDEKIDGILRSQLLASEYKKSCSRVIENNGALTEAFGQIREAMR
ncbi:MAG: dephospho-CoA kinase [Eubacterium sp.]|nr:dephospho-CoA kinase [Eubacterium sp.]